MAIKGQGERLKEQGTAIEDLQVTTEQIQDKVAQLTDTDGQVKLIRGEVNEMDAIVYRLLDDSFKMQEELKKLKEEQLRISKKVDSSTSFYPPQISGEIEQKPAKEAVNLNDISKIEVKPVSQNIPESTVNLIKTEPIQKEDSSKPSQKPVEVKIEANPPKIKESQKRSPEATSISDEEIDDYIISAQILKTLANNRLLFECKIITNASGVKEVQRGLCISDEAAMKKLDKNESIIIMHPRIKNESKGDMIYRIPSYEKLQRFNAFENLSAIKTDYSLTDEEVKARDILKKYEGNESLAPGLFIARDGNISPIRSSINDVIYYLKSEHTLRIVNHSGEVRNIENMDELFEFGKSPLFMPLFM
jgi:hypothetical protein